MSNGGYYKALVRLITKSQAAMRIKSSHNTMYTMKKAHGQGGVRICKQVSYWETPYDLLPTAALFFFLPLSSLLPSYPA